jgi:hypothetical protein
VKCLPTAIKIGVPPRAADPSGTSAQARVPRAPCRRPPATAEQELREGLAQYYTQQVWARLGDQPARMLTAYVSLLENQAAPAGVEPQVPPDLPLPLGHEIRSGATTRVETRWRAMMKSAISVFPVPVGFTITPRPPPAPKPEWLPPGRASAEAATAGAVGTRRSARPCPQTRATRRPRPRTGADG